MKEKKHYLNYLLAVFATMCLTACPEQAEPEISLSPSEVEFDYTGGTKSIKVYSTCGDSPASWKITSEIPAFLTIDPMSGTGNTNVTLIADMNKSEVSDDVVITFDNGKEEYLHVFRAENPTVACSAEPVDVLSFSNGIVCGVKLGTSCKYYYTALYKKDEVNKMTDEDISAKFDPIKLQPCYNVSCLCAPGTIARIEGCDELKESEGIIDFILTHYPSDTITEEMRGLLTQITVRVLGYVDSKEELCDAVSQHPRRDRFVATHPMWGTEYSGPAAAREDAFVGRTAVILERERSAADALETVEGIYDKIGMARISMSSGEEHDLHAAYVSHISHITSFALALTVLEKEREEQHIFDLAGGGFESTVRLAKSSATTWTPIFLKNKYNVLDVLREHIHQLQILRKMIETDDVEGLNAAMHRANSIQKILK